jgi:hypothetical protein
VSLRMTKAALTHGLFDQEGSNLDEIDREEYSVTAYEYEDPGKDKTDQLQSLFRLETKSFNASQHPSSNVTLGLQGARGRGPWAEEVHGRQESSAGHQKLRLDSIEPVVVRR